jgi:hypothetical protein
MQFRQKTQLKHKHKESNNVQFGYNIILATEMKTK